MFSSVTRTCSSAFSEDEKEGGVVADGLSLLIWMPSRLDEITERILKYITIILKTAANETRSKRENEK